MGNWGPSVYNLDSGWYLTTKEPNYAEERDQCLQWWNDDCQAILRKYLQEYGMFFTAFEEAIRSDIRKSIKGSTPIPRYFCYLIKSLVLSNPELAAIYFRDYDTRAQKTIECVTCNTSHTYDDIDIRIMERAKKVLPLCNRCAVIVGRVSSLENLTSIPSELMDRFQRLRNKQECAVCHKVFAWLSQRTAYGFQIEWLPTRHVEICSKCVTRSVTISRSDKFEQHALHRLKQISDLLGTIPDRFGFVYDQAINLETAVKIVKLTRRMPPIHVLVNKYGSWLKVLVASGILLDGTRRTRYGTMVVAQDGHDCLSLAEKSIDDLLYKHGIPHEKEPKYSGSSFRADWSIIVGGETVLVEYFGLDKKDAYATRMKEKLDYASRRGIRIIAFCPKDMEDLRGAFSKKILPLFPDKTPETDFAEHFTDVREWH